MTALFIKASFVANAMCGVAIKFFAFSKGCSSAIGCSVSNTSTPAPAILPSFKAI